MKPQHGKRQKKRNSDESMPPVSLVTGNLEHHGVQRRCVQGKGQKNDRYA
jgi:hypothetical protein